MPKPRQPKRRTLSDQPGATAPLDGEDLIQRIGLRWSALAAAIATALFFWLWQFLDYSLVRSEVLMLVFSPEIWIGEWFGSNDPSATVSLLDRGPILLTALLIVVASLGPGSLLVTLLTKKGSLDKLEHITLSIGAGLNLASLYVLAVGLIPGSLHQPWWIWLGVLFGLLTLPAMIYQLIRPGEAPPATGEDDQPPAAKAAWSERSAGWIIGLLSLPYLFGGMLPPWDFDVREYHLQAPKEWLQRGQIDFLPHNIYANMPLGAEVQAITATTILGGGDGAWWLGGLTAKTLMSLFAPLTAVLLWCIGRRSQLPKVGLVAAVCYLSLPWVAHVSLSGLNDAALGYYLLATWWVWHKSETGDWRALILSGFFAGAASAIKYPALIFVVLPLFVETLMRKLGLRGTNRTSTFRLNRFGHAAMGLLLLLIGLFAGGSLWYVKNKVQTGNPFYPLLAKSLGGETRTPEKDARWVKAHAVPQDEQGRRFTLAQLYGGLSQFMFRGANASPLLLPLLLLGCWSIVRQWLWHAPEQGPSLRFPLLAIGVFSFALAAWFLVTHRLERFLVPTLPLAALLAGYGYAYAKEQAGPLIARSFLFVGLVYSLIFTLGTWGVADPRWFVALQHLRSDPLHTDERNPQPQRLSPAERWINDYVAIDEGVLLVGGARVWDLPGQPQRTNIFYNTCFDDCLFTNWTADKQPEEQRAAFEERGVRYVSVDWSELRRYLSPGNYGYDPRFSAKQIDKLVADRVLKEEVRLGPDTQWKDKKRPRPPQQIYRVLTSAEATAAAAAARAGQKAATKNIKPTPTAAPPTSANQSKKSG
ncbi:hypothetical protein ETAA8_02360 [Anatilimnocola aggregata]|uniref:Glycosyltransferase RgtA/B/C/D-like domain-containing protein n=1 Tax=Anatilimnocola aggregata TaxID=2528021 RepID=A0A517Y4K2_9BACT|nr:hypothetical protein ETAA8_02360 [Anatilimnocola aggregata]